MTRPFVQLDEPREGIVRLTLDRPERRNALAEEAIRELAAALLEAGERETTRALVLTANGPVFCAGHDYADMEGRDLDGMRSLLSVCAGLMLTVRDLPQPVVAAVGGLATGAGCQLALTADLVVASSEAAFQTPGGRGGWFCTTPMIAVQRAVGEKRALEMLYTGDAVPAEQALAWGMVNRVVAPEALADEALDLADRASQGDPGSKAIGKAAWNATVDRDLRSAYDHAIEVMAASGLRESALAGLQAFLDRRRKKRQPAAD